MDEQKAGEIVRALAASDPDEVTDEGSWCHYCGVRGYFLSSNDPADHKPDCLWRRACEWATANPATG